MVRASSKPNVQRRLAKNATLFKRRSMVSAHLSKNLRDQYKRRSMSLRKGDEVKVMIGNHAGKTGTVESVNSIKSSVTITGIKLKRTIGTEKQVPIKSDNLIIMSLNLGDKRRQKILLRKVKEVKVEPKVEKPAAKEIPKPAAEKAEQKSVKAEDKKVEKENEHASEKTTSAKVLDGSQKEKSVGSVTKAGSA